MIGNPFDSNMQTLNRSFCLLGLLFREIKVLGDCTVKSTGIVRKVDELGRVVIPIELRRTLGIGEKDALEIYVDGDRIILKKYEPASFADKQMRSSTSRVRTSARPASEK